MKYCVMLRSLSLVSLCSSVVLQLQLADCTSSKYQSLEHAKDCLTPLKNFTQQHGSNKKLTNISTESYTVHKFESKHFFSSWIKTSPRLLMTKLLFSRTLRASKYFRQVIHKPKIAQVAQTKQHLSHLFLVFGLGPTSKGPSI